MPKFATQIVTSIKAREVVEELVVDGKSVLQEYKDEMKGTPYEKELGAMMKYIEKAADGHSLPKEKMRKYKGNKDGVAEYEFKTKHLRLWAIQQPNKKLLIFGGFKNSQGKDEVKFRSRKKQFLESLK